MAPGLADHGHKPRDQQTRQADDEEDHLPGLNQTDDRHHHRAVRLGQLQDIGADDQGQTAADRIAKGEDADGEGAALGLEIVADQRIGRGAEGGFPDADRHPRAEQMAEGARQAAGRRGQAPQDNAPSQKLAAIAPIVDDAPNRHGRHGDQQHGGEALHQTDLEVVQLQVLANVRHHQGHDPRVDGRDRVADEQQDHDRPGIGARRLFLGTGCRFASLHRRFVIGDHPGYWRIIQDGHR